MKKLLACSGFILWFWPSYAQVGNGTATPNTSAQLEVAADNRGILIPRILSSNLPQNPAQGLLVYVTGGNSPGFNYFDGTYWKQLAPCFIGTNNSSFFGYQIGSNNKGTDNTAMGFNALLNVSTGQHNTGIGSLALSQNIVGSDNTAVGYGVLFTGSGANNTGVGSQALSNNTSGNDNTAIGYKAGPGKNLGNLMNTTAIGSGAITTANNTVVIGNTFVTQIEGYSGWTTLSDGRFKMNIQPEAHGLDFIMKLKPITYNLNMKKLNSFIYGRKADSLFRTAAEKEGIEKKQRILYSGFSAQQVEEAAQSLGYDFSAVHKPENNNDHYGLEYASFVVPLVKAVQEQQQIIEKLMMENEFMKAQLDQLKQEEKENADALRELKSILIKAEPD